jgi:hypothetical protein
LLPEKRTSATTMETGRLTDTNALSPYPAAHLLPDRVMAVCAFWGFLINPATLASNEVNADKQSGPQLGRATG